MLDAISVNSFWGSFGGGSSFSPLEHTPKQNSFIWLGISCVLQLQAFPSSKKLSFIVLQIIQKEKLGKKLGFVTKTTAIIYF